MTDDTSFNGEPHIRDISFADVSFQNDHGQSTGELYGTSDLSDDPCGIQYLSSDHYMSPPFHPCLEEIARLGEIEYSLGKLVEPRKEQQDSFSLPSLQILPRFGSGLRKFNSIAPSDDTSRTVVVRQRSSTAEIIRIAEAKFIHSSFSTLSDEEAQKVELTELLLASASRVGNQQFDSARKLLNHCDTLSSSSGNPVQRLVFHFSAALRGRIDQETGKVLKGSRRERPIEICEESMLASPTIGYYQSMPFMQVLNFAGVQAIVDHVAEAKRIHIIDFRIRNGKQWIILMQALASRSGFPLHLLKITAVGTSTNHQYIQSTGERLTSFARTMNLPFSFKVVRVSDMIHLKDAFELDPAEKVVVFAEFLIPFLIKQPDRLISLMTVIKNLNPCVMVLNELEANLSSPDFMSRFTEALVFFGAFFDSHENCMERDDPARRFGESIFLSELINGVVADDKGEMYSGSANMEVFRETFAHFGMKETGLSTSALYQANLVLNNFDCWHPCTLSIDGKSLITGWKGTPLISLSLWKFTYSTCGRTSESKASNILYSLCSFNAAAHVSSFLKKGESHLLVTCINQ